MRSLRAVAVAATLAVTMIGLGSVAPPASADTAPPAGTPSTVSADALPTWQVNGVVWSQVVVNNVVYVTGSFTQARPPGVAVGGAGSIAANNIFAYNVTTGNAVTTFSHQLNAQGLVIRASADGSKVYVGGDFTTVDGVARNHIAAFNTAAGALDATFHPSLSATVQGIAVSPTTVYVGGSFFSVNGSTRRRLAAFSSTGALRPWAPTADDNKVAAMVLSPDRSKVIVGGSFTTLNGQVASGMGALDATTGATMPWAINKVVTNGGTKCGITNLSVDNNQVYGGGFAFGCGNFEGTFAADANTGAVSWVNDCHGDTYDTYPVGQVLYSVSHAHNCSFIGDFPNSSPTWSINMRHALAFTTYPTGTNAGVDDYGWNYTNVPDSSLLQWFPAVAVGTYTGQSQAAWSLAGNASYLAMGGEFPSVNGTAQQGLTRFAVKTIAPNKCGPVKAAGAPVPAAQSFTAGQARVSWQSAYDMDNATLTYNVYRSGTTAPIYTTTGDSTYWNYPMKGYIDKNLSPGASYTYKVTATDPFGNTTNLGTSSSVTITAGSQSKYAQDVVNDGATDFWRLGEPSGTAVYDHAGFNDATAQTGVTRGASGAIAGDSDGASTFNGGTDGVVATNSAQPVTPNLSIEAWVKTTTNQGGKIVGYGDQSSGNSGSYDRHIYMDNAGHIIFGVYNNNTSTITTPKTYNDGGWHQIVGTLDATNGMTLYIDGKKVGVNQGATVAQPYTGYWRIGGDNIGGWPNQPSSSYFAGAIDDVAIYPSALGLNSVQQHYVDAGGALGIPTAPSDAYGKAVFNAGPDLYWRLGDSSGTTAKDSSPNGDDGILTGGVTLNQPSGISGTTDTSAAFNGSDGTIGSANQQAGPSVYSEELWFKTDTTHGGKLIGFGNQQSGNSGAYDRHVYMENSGQLTFGTWTGQTNTATSPLSYNNNQWHYMVATQGSDGMHLYVDGAEVATNPQTGQQAYDGYWRVGGDSDWGGDSPYLNGTIDEVAVYSSELTPAAIKAHYVAGGGSAANQAPVASFTDSEAGLKASFDGSASADPDGSIASYAWDFADGTSSTDVSPNHTYLHAGDYSVKLTVTDNQGATNTSLRTIHVTNTPPTAAFTTTTNGLTVSVDGSNSADPDGTLVSYDWDWGDGTPHGSGVSPNHTYGSTGTDTITLTVTDSDGATAMVSHDVNPASNQSPTASFTDSEAGLKASFNGSASADPDGTIASYDWDFGDGTTHASVASPNHTYSNTGDYPVKLTVTDNQGATGTVMRTIHVTNIAPNAAFTTTVTGLSASADGSGSNDPDGTIAAYDWNWGDGSAHSTGATPNHTYAVGTYTVTLTVTDNAGGTNSVQHSVTVSNPAPTAIASDDFGRSVSNGWGSADLGGAWTIAGKTANFKVGSGVGTLSLVTAGTGPSANLKSISTTNADVRVRFSPQVIANGTGTYTSLIGRQVPGVGNYRAVVNVKANGQVALTLVRLDGAGQATIALVNVPGLTVAAGSVLDARFVVAGTSPTVLQAKVWQDGQSEPSGWQITGSDNSGPMQAAGSVGLMSYVSANATNVPVAVTFDSFRAYDSTTTIGARQQVLMAKVAALVVKHPSRAPTLATRVAPDFHARKRF